MTDLVRTEIRNAALWITIDRPAKRNAMNAEILAGIEAALADPPAEARAVVLTGAGSRAFCAGADLSGGTAVFARTLDEPTTDFGRLARRMHGLGLPSIARINGDCLAGGIGLLGMCDLAVAADHARFGLPEVGVGVFPMQVLVYLRGLVGARALNELCLLGGMIDAARAREIGLVNEVVPEAALDARIDALARRLAAVSPTAIRRGKHAIAAMARMGFAEALSFAEAAIAATAMTDDAREGLAAFNARRAPRWGRPDGSAEDGSAEE
jgi:methylglutaconyl-CoA hydratase